jgi:hypothetical protein
VAIKTSDKLINTNNSVAGKVASKGSIDKLIVIDVIEITIDLFLSKITLVLSICVSYAR